MTTSTACLPSWHATYAPIAATLTQVVSSGVSTSGGNVQAAPADLRAAAEASLRAGGFLASGATLTQDAYTLGRYMQSEVGDRSVEEWVAVGQAGVNQAALRGVSVTTLLAYSSSSNAGYYGPIEGGYDRWASTGSDPTVATLLVGIAIDNGDIPAFNNGADDQDGLEYASSFPDPESKIDAEAAAGSYWVGQLPGVDAWSTTQWVRYGYAADSAEGQFLVARAKTWFGDRYRDGDFWRANHPIDWSSYPVCPASSGVRNVLLGIGLFAAGRLLVDLGVAVAERRGWLRR